MIHECTYCDYNTATKYNIRRHVRNKHTEKISLEKDHGKPMKNDHHKELKKIETMMKKNFQTRVEIETMKRKVKSISERNAIEFKELAQEYVELTDAGLPKDFFNSLCGVPPPPPSPTLFQLPAAPPTIENTDLIKTEGDLFGNDEAVGLFGDKIVEDNKQSIYKNCV